MDRQRVYRDFVHKEAVFRICCDRFDAVVAEIVRQRRILERYIERQPEFGSSFEPVELLEDAPESARRMARAAQAVGVGPMAGVAGVMAELAARAGLAAGAGEAIVDNGGDIYLQAADAVVVALAPGSAELSGRLGLALEARDTPISICSSSGLMGHSTSLGRCELATVVAKDAALADAAATLCANLVEAAADIEDALQRIDQIEGVDGVMVVQQGRVGLVGRLPRLVKID